MSIEQISGIATIADITIKYGGAALGIIGGTAGALAYRKSRKFHKVKDNRLYRNIQRPFAVVSTEQQSLTHEIDLLERTKFFKPEHFGAGGRNLQLLGDIKPRLLVVGYSPNSTIYQDAFDYARTHSLPLVVFTPHQIADRPDLDAIKAYSFGSLCQTELRLVSDVFSVMSTFPEDK